MLLKEYTSFLPVMLLLPSLAAAQGPTQDPAQAPSPAADAIRRAVARALGEKDAPLEALARGIADRHGRDAIPHLVDALLRFDAPPRTPATNLNGGWWVIVRTLVLVLDPRDEHGLKSSRCWSYWMTATRLAVAALAEHGGDDARELLIRLATGRYEFNDLVAGVTSSVACGLLRADADPDGLARRVRPTLTGEKTAQQANLRALLSSLEHRRALVDPRRRDAYAAFEKKLWRTWALTPPNDARKANREYGDAALALHPLLAADDGPFVLRVFQDVTTTDEETRIASALAGRLRDPRIRQGLEAVAAGDSPKAAAARQALEALERIERSHARQPVHGPQPKR